MEEAGSAVWITAPPGAGKTTLAASYAAAAKRTTLWYRIDSGDADPAAFFHFMGIAAANVAPRRRAPLPRLTPEYLPDLAGFARRFFRTLFERLPTGSAVVFDNYHELDAFPGFHDIMRIGLEETPAGIQVVILSRTAPPPALARLVANRGLRLLGWEDMRLTLDEVALLAEADFDMESVRHLHAQSGGWAAGAILLLHSGSVTDSGLKLESRQSVFNYFAAEIFADIPEDVRRFLIRTAFFPDFTAAMAQTVSGIADVERILAQLCGQHCFIERMGVRAESYRYHDLFRDFLRAQAGKEARDFRGAAARVLAEAGRATDAIALFLENGDGQTAIPLILGEAQALITQGRWQTLAGWIDALPPGMTETVPWLSFWRGVTEIPVKPSAGRALIEHAYDRFLSVGDTTGQMIAAATVIEANFYEWGDFSILDRWIEVLESLVGAHPVFPSPEVGMRVLTGILMAASHRRPTHPGTQALVDRLETLLDTDIDANQKGITAAFMLWHTFWIGDFAQMRRIHALAGRLLEERRMAPITNILLHCMKGQGEIFLGDNAGARQVFDEAEAIARTHGFALAHTSYVLSIQAYRCLSFGDLAAAEQVIDEAAGVPFSGLMNASQNQFARSWLALQRGNVRQAAEHIRAARELAEKSGSFVARAWTEAGWALIHALAGKADDARRHIDAARAIVDGRTTGLLPYHLTLVEAWVALRGGDTAACHGCLRRSLAHAATHGLANTLQWLPAMMSELCAEALREGIETGYVRDLIRKRGLAPPSPDIEAWPWPLEIRTLGIFEVLKDGERIEFTGKTPKKPIALLKALIACGGRDVPEARLINALWPDGNVGDALAVNLHRLRKLLGDGDAIQMQGGRIGLNPGVFWVDTWAFERLVEQAWKPAAKHPGDCLEFSRRALALYRGNFLADDIDAVWAVSTRERLRAKLIRHVVDTVKLFCERKACEHVIEACARGLEVDDLVEPFYQELMRCHLCQGRNVEGLAVYRRMKHVFSVVLGVAPSPASEVLYRKLRNA